MALATNAIDINRNTTGVVLPKELSDEIWANAIEDSVIMRVAPRIDLPGNGVVVPLITGDATAEWVGETNEKAVSHATLSSKSIQAHKIAVIELFSMEFRRDLERVYEELVRRLPMSIGKKFDETVFGTVAPGSNFDTLGNSTAVSLTPGSGDTVYTQLVTAYSTVGTAGYELTRWVMAPQAMGTLLGAVDGNKRPLLIDSANTDGAVGSILGAAVEKSRHAYKAGTPATLGFAGDWSQARWGMVNPGITVSISDQATINDGTNQINLWQRNMFAVRVEAELGFVVKDAAAFVKITA